MKLARNLRLPDDVATWRSALVGRTGSGKTNTAVLLAEQMIARNWPLVILDPQGDWWGLRSKYQIAILGGDHGDAPLEPTAGSVVADFVVHERVPVLLDLFRFGEGEMIQFATDFARRLWTTNREALTLFVDEADLFAPQSGMKGQKAVCLGQWQNIVRRGRSRGLGVCMLTQRPACLNKDLLTQADPLIVHRLTAPQDLEAVRAYLEFHGQTKEEIKQHLAAIAKFQVGAALVISPGSLEIEPRRIQVARRKSFDSSATPRSGAKAAKPKSFASVDLAALQKRMAATIERAKREDPKELRRQLAEAEAKVAAAGEQVREVTATVEVPVFRPGEVEAVCRAIEDLREAAAVLGNSVAHEAGRLAELVDRVAGAKQPAAPALRPPASVEPVARVDRRRPDNGKLPKGQRAHLVALSEVYPLRVTKPQLARLAGHKSQKSSTFDQYLRRNKSAGYVVDHGSEFELTPAGAAAAGVTLRQVPPARQERIELFRRVLAGGERALFDAVLQGAATKEALSAAAGYSYTSSTFDQYLRTLRRNGLIEVDGETIRLGEAVI